MYIRMIPKYARQRTWSRIVHNDVTYKALKFALQKVDCEGSMIKNNKTRI